MIPKDDKHRSIAYCGLYCADCPWHTGKVADLSRDLRKELRNIKFDRLAEFISDYPQFAVFKNYPECYEVLGALMKGRCKTTCQEGGGPLSCKIRKCCQKSGLMGCWECDEFNSCEILDQLTPGHGDAHKRNLGLIRRKGMDAFIEGKKYWFTTNKEEEKDAV